MKEGRRFRLFTFSVIIFLGFLACKNDVPAEPEPEYDTSISLPELTVYEAPTGAPKNFMYNVYVRYDGGEWIDLFEYNAPAVGNQSGFSPTGNMAFVYFDADYSKRIDVKVEKKGVTINDVKIRPVSAGIQPSVNGNMVEFSLTRSQKLSIEINGDQLNNLMVFANDLETEIPDSTSALVHYFGPGIHKIGADGTGTLTVNSNETVYIAGGAIVYGHIAVKSPSYNRISNVTIKGRGILSGDMETGHSYTHPNHGSTPALIALNIVENVNIEGIILHNTVTWNVHMYFCKDVNVRDLKVMSWTINSDGIDPQYSSDVLIDNCFVRNNDDCTSIKLNWYQGNNSPPSDQPVHGENITIQNSTYWADKGRAVLIGPELASVKYDHQVRNITVRNMDILYIDSYDIIGIEWAKGVLAINCGDDATVKDVLFEDIRVDQLGFNTNLITINMVATQYSASEGKRVENITFNNVSCNVTPSLNNYIHGFGTDRLVSGITFNNLMINGSLIHNAAEGNFDVNEFTENIQFVVTK
jgi:hypothetical protein